MTSGIDQLSDKERETLRLMLAHGILTPVLPEIDAEGLQRLARTARRESAAGVAPDPIRRLAALLRRDPATGDAVGARLKLSNLQRKRLCAAMAEPTGTARELGYRAGLEAATDRLLLSDARDDHVAKALAELRGWTPPRLPLTGGAIVARGVGKGPDVASLLRQVEDQWAAEDFPPARRAEEIADAVVSAWLRDARSA